MSHYSRRDNIRHQRRPSFKRQSIAQRRGPLEGAFYELKPILYLLFTLSIFRTNYVLSLGIKYTTLAIGAFAVYIIYCRLQHRGHI